MAGGSDEFSTDEDKTEPGGGSALAAALRDLAFSLNEIVRDLGESTRLIDEMEADERRVALRAIAEKLAEHGSLSFDTSRAIREIADEGYSLISF